MNRIFALLFAFGYLISVSGLALNMHYCGGELNCISLIVPDDCCECPEDAPPSCCSDSGLFLKASDDSHLQVNSEFSFKIAAVEVLASQFVVPHQILAKFHQSEVYAFADLPPPDRVIAYRRLLI